MLAAIACWNGEISPVFDVSRSLLLVRVGRCGVVPGQAHAMMTMHPVQRASEIRKLGVRHLFCGAISSPYEQALRLQGIEVQPFLCGKVDALLEALERAIPLDPAFSMPGCQKQNRCCEKNLKQTYENT